MFILTVVTTDVAEAQAATGSSSGTGEVAVVENLIGSTVLAGSVVMAAFAKHNAANKKTSATKYVDKSESSFKKCSERHVRTYEKVDKDFYKKKE